MNLIQKILILLIPLVGIHGLQAQNKNYDKAVECFNDGKYEKALKQIEKAKTDNLQSRKSETYLLESKVLLKLSDKNPNSDFTRDAVKAAIKAKDKSEDPNFVHANQAHYNEIAKINMTEAMSYYNAQRYTKAIVLFKRSLELNEDSFAQYLLAKSYILYNDYRRGMQIFDDLINKQYSHYVQSGLKPSFMSEAFNMYTDALVAKNHSDSAELYLKMGLEMYPRDKDLLAKQKKVWYHRLTEIPLSFTLFDFLNKATNTYPYDSIFTFKKNGVYLMFIGNNIKANDIVAADSWLNRFIAEKTKLANASTTERQKSWDYFLENDQSIILEKLLFYFGNYGQTDAQNYVFDKYVTNKFGKSKDAESLKYLENIFPANIVASLYAYKINEDQTKSLTQQRNSWYQTLLDNREKIASDYEAILSINRSILNNHNRVKLEEDYQNLLFAYWDHSLDMKDFWKAYELGNVAQKKYAERAKGLWEKTIKADFYENYFGSRVLLNTPNTKAYGFTWNGSVSDCNPGYLPDTIYDKVVQRINYFRRTAGITNPIALMANYNLSCQAAALFFTANSNLTHDLSADLYCYSFNAAKAGKYGLLSQGMHTAIAITEFMNDNTPSTGNRRWFLYPPTQFMGYGCTNDKNVLWCVNENNDWDTAQFINTGIAWPPSGYSPRMFAFKNWSYSAYQNFDGATVTLTRLSDNRVVPCTVFEQVNGYGMPTLVWQPDMLIRKGQENEDYKVAIKLKNGKTVSYVVHLLNI